MTQTIHLANTDVEYELAQPNSYTLKKSWLQHPFCLQLQFLPLLFAEQTDLIAVSHIPSSDYIKDLEELGWWPNGLPTLILMDDDEKFTGYQCKSWGYSKALKSWCDEKHMSYSMPKDWEIIRLVNSKAFSFRYSNLENSTLLFNQNDLISWLKKIPNRGVLKSCFGLSGLGNKQVDESVSFASLLKFCQKEWGKGRCIIAEPWLERLYDFSTQWFIHSNAKIELIGATRFATDVQGNYIGTLAGPENELFTTLKTYLEIHKLEAIKALTDIAQLGYFGHVGIDSLIYRNPDNDEMCLYPIVEINARQTMSLVALYLQKKICPKQYLRLNFNQIDTLPTMPSLLPKYLEIENGKRYAFRRKLTAVFEKEI